MSNTTFRDMIDAGMSKARQSGGWQPIPRSKFGGDRRRVGNRWQYRYKNKRNAVFAHFHHMNEAARMGPVQGQFFHHERAVGARESIEAGRYELGEGRGVTPDRERHEWALELAYREGEETPPEEIDRRYQEHMARLETEGWEPHKMEREDHEENLTYAPAGYHDRVRDEEIFQAERRKRGW